MPLNELAMADWELATLIPASVPAQEKFASEKWVGAVILVNRKLDASQEVERKIGKIKKQISQVEAEIEEESSSMKKASLSFTVRELREQLEKLQQK